jgi:capsule polysaccharide export protein KpsE/RkpR
LGDMETALTKKVEELTLYVIQKDEQLTKQKAVIDNQQKEIEGLKAEMKAIELKLISDK